jgi:hypothetical protein
MSSRSSIKTPFCNACYKAGKPESLYTSHFPKSDKGVSICPTILSAQCGYCGKSGHWANDTHCSAMRRDKERAIRPLEVKSKPVTPPTVSNKGGFAVLDDDDECYQENTFKKIKTKTKTKISTDKISWAKLAVTPNKELEETHNIVVPKHKYIFKKIHYDGNIEKEASRLLKEGEAMKILNERKSYFNDEYNTDWNEYSDDIYN